MVVQKVVQVTLHWEWLKQELLVVLLARRVAHQYAPVGTLHSQHHVSWWWRKRKGTAHKQTQVSHRITLMAWLPKTLPGGRRNHDMLVVCGAAAHVNRRTS